MVRQCVDALAPTNFPATNPEVIERALATDGLSLAQGVANLAADLGPRAHLDERRARVRGRPQSRGDARARRLPQSADRADPVRADDGARAPAAARHRSALHQQVLHPRPAAVELVRPLRRRAGPHRVRHLVAQRAARARAPRLGRLPRAGRADGDRRREGRSRGARRSTRSASASAARCSRARSPCSRRAATAASRARPS